MTFFCCHSAFDMHLNRKDCESYYCNQVGGGGPYFRGTLHQRGYGFFGDLGRYLTPLAVKASRYLGTRLFDAGKNVINDVASGQSFRNASRNRFRETTAKIKKDILNKFQQQGRGKNKAIKRKQKRKSGQSRAKRCKTTQRDIFS